MHAAQTVGSVDVKGSQNDGLSPIGRFEILQFNHVIASPLTGKAPLLRHFKRLAPSDAAQNNLGLIEFAVSLVLRVSGRPSGPPGGV